MIAPEPVVFRDGNTQLTGWLFRPATSARAAILLCPTIINRNAAMDRRATMLAHAGFAVFIADYYGKADLDFAEAQQLAAKLRKENTFYRNRLRCNLDAMKEVSTTKNIAAIGFCLGGQAVLELARDGADIAAAISMHGLLDTSAPATRRIAPRLLVCHGDADPLVPRAQVAAFQDEMTAVGADWQLMVFSNVRHGFTDPASDERDVEAVAYDAHADRQSWSAAMLMLEETFS